MAAAREISVGDAVAAVLSEQNFLRKKIENQHWNIFSADNIGDWSSAMKS